MLLSIPKARTRRVHHLLGPLLWVIVGVLVKGSPGPQQYRVIVVHLSVGCSRAADVFAREPMRPRASDPWAHLVARPQLPRTIPGRFQAGPAGAPPGNVSVFMNSPASRREPGLLTAPVRRLGHHTDGRPRAKGACVCGTSLTKNYDYVNVQFELETAR